MAIIVHHDREIITASTGTISRNVKAGQNICHQIYIKADTATTTFDIKLIDIYGDTVFEREQITGLLNEEVTLLTYGNWTLTILNASADEAFTTNFVFRESGLTN